MDEAVASSTLPSYANPPVAEVACSLQYADSLDFGLEQLLVVRTYFADQFPGLEEHPPLPRMDVDGTGPPFELVQSGGPFLPRLWFLSDPPNDLVQLQRDRLTVNWRKADESEGYLRYDTHVRPLLENAHSRFVEGLSRLGLSEPSIDAFELAYVNPIPLEDGDTFASILRTMRDVDEGGLLGQPDRLSMRLNYAIPDVGGSLNIEVSDAKRVSDDARAALVQLTVRGRVDGSFDDLLRRLAVAREWIVRGFTEVTTDQMHQRWGRES